MIISVVILTKNEERHIERAIRSVASFADRIYVIDSGSLDRTVDIAREAGAKIMVNPFITQAQQFNWALDQLPSDTDWVLRLDADEIITPELTRSIANGLAKLEPEISGVYLLRRMTFLGRPIRWGGVFPIRILRLFRYNKGRCENRWMDEHIRVEGKTTSFSGELIDNNLNSLTWWTEKHNSYASREVVDLLNLELSFWPHETRVGVRGAEQAGVKRWLKEKVYARLPGGQRAFLYFFYRYIIRFGFLDGREGAAFHVLQAFWYRFLVDAKLSEVKMYMQLNGVDVVTAIDDVLGIKIKSGEKSFN